MRKTHGPNYWFILLGVFLWVLLTVADVVTSDSLSLGYLVFSVFMFLGIVYFLSIQIIIDDHGINSLIKIFHVSHSMKWEDITKISYWKNFVMGDVAFITDKKGKTFMIDRKFTHHVNLIKTILSKTPQTAQVDSGLYTELDVKLISWKYIGWGLLLGVIFCGIHILYRLVT